MNNVYLLTQDADKQSACYQGKFSKQNVTNETPFKRWLVVVYAVANISFSRFQELSKTIFLIFALVFMSGFNSAFAATIFETFSGTVNDEFENKLNGADVSINGVKVKTNAAGIFTAVVPRANRYAINASMKGFSINSQIQNSLFGETNLKLTISRADSISNINPANPILITDTSDTTIDLPNNGLVTATGVVPTGLVTAYLHTYNLAEEGMPGDRSTNTGYLESGGAFSVEFYDANGDKLNLAPSKTAKISIPANDNTETTIDLWFYNETTGKWEIGGTATRVNINGVWYYEGEVNHFSSWNFDWEKTQPACVGFKIEQSFIDANRTPIDPINSIVIEAVVTPLPPSTVKPDSRKGQFRSTLFDPNSHVIFNIPANTKVDFYLSPFKAGGVTPFHTIDNTGTTTYGGDIPPIDSDGSGNYSVCGPGNQVVFTGLGTSITASPSLVTPINSPVTLTATQKGSTPTPVATGQIQFTDGVGNPIGSPVTLDSNGKATLVVPVLSAGSYKFKADYLPGGNYPPSSSATPATVNVIAATININASPTTVARTQPVTLYATVEGVGVDLNGTVQFKDGEVNLSSPIPLVNGRATYTTLNTQLTTVGTHPITAVYSGNAKNSGNTSGAWPITVVSSAILLSATPVTAQGNTTLRAKVTGVSPTGTVSFFKNGSATAIGSSQLDGNGEATLTTTAAIGDVITAIYEGDGGNAQSTTETGVVLTTNSQVAPALPAWGMLLLALGLISIFRLRSSHV